MKKLVLITMSLCLLLGIAVGCMPGGSAEPTPAAGAYKPGTYTATAEAHNGPLTLSVTFSDRAITAIDIDEHMETTGLSDPVFEQVPAQIIERQSLEVDAIAGATYTADAVLEAVRDCIGQASNAA